MVTAMLIPWAETIPWVCLVRPTNCISPDHAHDPMVDDPCAICDQPLVIDEVCYAVIELPRDARDREQWVCWRHVRDEPIRVED